MVARGGLTRLRSTHLTVATIDHGARWACAFVRLGAGRTSYMLHAAGALGDRLGFVGVVVEEVKVGAVLMQQAVGAGKSDKGAGELTELAELI